VSPEARIIGFVVLMVAVFLGAYQAGSRIGPVIPAHAPVQSPGGGLPPTMNMGASPARLLSPAISSPHHQ
jgi:hypothetical protein